jgi:hypothetical protein
MVSPKWNLKSKGKTPIIGPSNVELTLLQIFRQFEEIRPSPNFDRAHIGEFEQEWEEQLLRQSNQ